jgi:hypothetical protein
MVSGETPGQEREVSDESKRPRRKISGVYSARKVEELRISAVMCVGPQDASLVDAVRGELPDPMELVVVRSELELHEVQRELSAASFFALGTGTGVWVDAPKVLGSVESAWPSVPRLWFDRQARPVLPSPLPPELTGVQLWEQPFYADHGDLVDRLVVECEKGLAERMAQVASARAFATRYRLPKKGRMICTAIALRIPEARWGPFVGYDDSRQLNRYLSRNLYGRLNVKSRADLVREILVFQHLYLAGELLEPLSRTGE